MIPRSALEGLIGQQVKVYLKSLPEPHCVQIGMISSLTEHIIVLNDEAHTDISYIPIENIAFIKKL